MQIVIDAYLTRKPRVVAEVFFCRKDRLFGIKDRSRIAGKYFDTACRAASVPTAAVQDIDPIVFDREH
jgi:hypothetical protein